MGAPAYLISPDIIVVFLGESAGQLIDSQCPVPVGHGNGASMSVESLLNLWKRRQKETVQAKNGFIIMNIIAGKAGFIIIYQIK